MTKILKFAHNKYEVLDLSKDVNGSYTWESGLWPWEVKKDV